MLRLAVAGLVACTLATPLRAAPSPPADTVVVVTAFGPPERLGAIPAATFVFDRDAIRASGVSRVSTLLQRVPGLYGYLQNASGDPAVVDPRGFTANGTSSYIKLRVNGHDVRDVENGNVDWDWLIADDVQRVEVVEGPGAWRYGDGSEGGIVNVVQPDAGGRLRGHGSLRTGSFGMRTGSLRVSGSEGGLGGSLRGAGRATDGWRDHSEERVYTAGGDVRVQVGPRTTLSFDAAGLDADREQPGTLSPAQMAADREQAETDTDFTHDRRLLLGARVLHRDGRGGEWSAAPYLRGEDLDQVSTLFFDTKFHHTRGWAGGADLGWRQTVRLGGRATTFHAGSQLERENLRSRWSDYGGPNPAQVANARSWRTTFSGYAGAQVALDPATTLRANVRGDLIRVETEDVLAGTRSDARDLRALSPFVSLMRMVGPGSVYANFSTAFHAPTLAQLFDRRPFFNPFTFSNVFLSNPELAPQRAVSVEVGGRVDGANGAFATMTLYSIRVRDEIDFDVATLSYANIGRSWHRGIQGAVEVPIAGRWAAHANGTWSPTTIRGGADDGRQINAVPIGTAYGSLRWRPLPSWSIEGGARWTGRQYLDKANDHPLGEFTVAELATAVTFAGVTANLRVMNLLDRRYADTGFYSDLTAEERVNPAAGRSVQFALSYP